MRTRRPSAWLELTRPVHEWLSYDPQWNVLSWSVRAKLGWTTRLATFNAALSRQITATKSGGADLPDPVLIVGPWRSGTTLMHDLLVAATALPAPQTWQCMNAASFAMRRKTVRRETSRPMDDVVIDSFSPQEDEFALLTLGAPSVYRGFLMPHRLGELDFTLDEKFWSEDSSWIETWTDFLVAVSATRSGERLPLVVKSPSHTYRLRAILRRFPRAKTIWMLRDPVELYSSNLHMWRTMFDLYALTEPVNESLESFVISAITRAVDGAARWHSELSGSQLMFMPLTSLQSNPEEQVRAACEWLGRPVSETELARRIAKLAPNARVAAPAKDVPAEIERASRTFRDMAAQRPNVVS